MIDRLVNWTKKSWSTAWEFHSVWSDYFQDFVNLVQWLEKISTGIGALSFQAKLSYRKHQIWVQLQDKVTGQNSLWNLVAPSKHLNSNHHLLFNILFFSLPPVPLLPLVFFYYPCSGLPGIAHFFSLHRIHAGSLACQLLICMLLNSCYLPSIHSHTPLLHLSNLTIKQNAPELINY